MGPLISGRRSATPWSRPTCDGAEVAYPRQRARAGPGFWFPPTVLTARSTGRRGTGARRSSARSPSVLPFDDEADAMRIANDTEYGLSGSIWTRDVGGRSGSRAVSRPGS